jgi:predicted DNA repair protein MutK
MAGTNLFTLLDDIATLLDDVAVMTKVAARKTVGVLGDDLALNAQQVAGVRADRELPVVWVVAKGSLVNKVILVPVALFVSAFFPWVITPLLMLGGTFLCLEGVEKLGHSLHVLWHRKRQVANTSFAGVDNPKLPVVHANSELSGDPAEMERERVRGAIRTDFVLSAEIIVITLGSVAGKTLAAQALVLTGIALLLTLGVYGLVAAIVKIDDFGIYLHAQKNLLARHLGRGLLLFAPLLMKFLAIAGTAAMFMVGGGILAHGVEPVHHLFEVLSAAAGPARALFAALLDMGFGLLTGLAAFFCLALPRMVISKRAAKVSGRPAER